MSDQKIRKIFSRGLRIIDTYEEATTHLLLGLVLLLVLNVAAALDLRLDYLHVHQLLQLSQVKESERGEEWSEMET